MNTFLAAYNTVLATFQNINILGSQKNEMKEIEGYLMFVDSTNNKTLLLVKENEKSWKTQWFNNNENTYKSPPLPLNEIFNKRN